MNDQELLKYMQDNNIIDMAYVQEQLEMKKKEGYFKQTSIQSMVGTRRILEDLFSKS